MLVIDNITEHLGLPLPHPDNDLEDDVPRLADALAAVDSAVHAAQQLLATKADADAVAQALADLDTAVQHLASTKANASSLAAKVGSVNGLTGTAITLLPEHLQLGPANGASAMAIERDGQGRPWRITTTEGGEPAVQTITYALSGNVQSITTTYKDRTRVETYSYVGGVFAGMTAEETTA